MNIFNLNEIKFEINCQAKNKSKQLSRFIKKKTQNLTKLFRLYNVVSNKKINFISYESENRRNNQIKN
ncbi:hypothetical protein BpHYR1_046264 [Brachionus plicatilis]|uniref:Uncharacterized protein n=1 Tax=Brachionus plicatilis TaxID=10195 RepID=A0A3M7S5Q4_BRAPC|nr:hypothetical protein BpHYR1_046264 [Brachionus plicatilis]